ncbi:MAG: sulfatase-like hydrolase/transferase, partial [Planctomycetota bacterium]
GLTLALAGAATAQQNVLLIIADDCGVDLIGAYGEHPGAANTPVLDQLAADGMLFRNAWANPSCSPTRAMLLTRRYAFRTGIGLAINWFLDTFELHPDEVTIADVLSPTHDTIAVGKWHISIRTASDGDHPNLLGFDDFYGNKSIFPGFISDDYYDFEKVINGVTTQSTVYSTTDTVNDALTLLGTSTNPWFMWMAFNAPHAPFHKPPANLHTYNLPPNVADDIPMHGRAMLEAMDTEIGRLFASMDPAELADTLIIFAGDNGTDKPIVLPPWDKNKAKNTIWEGGLNVPLIVKGPGVAAGTECGALVNLTDIAATVAEVKGVAMPTATDSVSMVPYFSDPGLPSIRPWVYSEFFRDNGYGPYSEWTRAVRDDRFKLIWEYDNSIGPTTLHLYDLDTDPFELVNLLDTPPLAPLAQASYDALTTAMSNVMPTWMDVGHGLAGTAGVPLLTGSGDPVVGNPITLALTRARPNASTALAIGFTTLSLPLKGGIIVPAPDILWTGLVTDGLGDLTLVANWPVPLPTGLRLSFQHWIIDPVGPFGYAASRAQLLNAP